MFRRIEVISALDYHPAGHNEPSVVGVGAGTVLGAFFTEVNLKAPRNLHKNVRFYFTEFGWDMYGRKLLRLAMQSGFETKVKSVKEKSVDVFYRDIWQVAVRPRKDKD